MNHNQAIEILTNVVNAAIQKGVFADVNSAALAAQALQIIKPANDGSTTEQQQQQ